MRALSRALAAFARQGRASACDERGFTLIEVLVAAMVLVIGLVGLLGLLDISVRTAGLDRTRQAENSLARQALEDARGLSYTQLTPAALATAVAAKVTNATASGSTMTVTRAGSAANDTFTVDFNSCSFDDPSDGYGSHGSSPASGGSWCPDSTGTGTADTQPDDFKRVTALVKETAGTRSAPSVEQTTLIYNPGPSLPAITCLTATAGTCPQGSYAVNHLLTPTLTFNVAANSTPYQIEWLVNGNGPGSSGLPSGASDPYSPGSASSTFNWTVPATAGTYTISAVPLDSAGDVGNTTSVVVTVS